MSANQLVRPPPPRKEAKKLATSGEEKSVPKPAAKPSTTQAPRPVAAPKIFEPPVAGRAEVGTDLHQEFEEDTLPGPGQPSVVAADPSPAPADNIGDDELDALLGKM